MFDEKFRQRLAVVFVHDGSNPGELMALSKKL
jgi:hypothetical protein